MLTVLSNVAFAGGRAKMQWSALQAQYERQSNLPLWILNTTEGQKEEGKPKSENLISLSKELQLGLESFIFLDDVYFSGLIQSFINLRQ